MSQVRRVRIAQISDLHINRKTSDSIVGMVKRILIEGKPDVLIVSGDLANQPVPWQMKKAAKIVRELTDACSASHVLTMPGNHDYKFWGNIGLRRLSRIAFEIYFRQEGLKFTWKQWFKTGTKLALNALWPWGKAMLEPVVAKTLDEWGVSLFAINSNSLAFMMAAGKVEARDLQDLYDAVDATKRFHFKIALVHHHPAPLADAPYDALSRLEDSFMIFYNAGLFVREMSRRGVQLVLHGHKHVAGFVRLAMDFQDQGRRELVVAAAGSATHPDPDDTRGNHLHFIDIYDDDTAELESRFFSVDTESKESTRRYDIATIADVRRNRYTAYQESLGYSSNEIRKTVSITRDGYSNVKVEMSGARSVRKDGLSCLPVELKTWRPIYLRGLTLADASALDRLAPHKDQLYEFSGKAVFGTPKVPSGGPFYFGYTYRLMNGHALTPGEFARHYSSRGLESEYVTMACDSASDVLTLTVEFPDGYDLSCVDFAAAARYISAPLAAASDPRFNDDSQFRDHVEETRRIEENLREEGQRRILTCPNPVPGFLYEIKWQFRTSNATPALSQVALEQRCQAAKRNLLALASHSGDPAWAGKWEQARSILQDLVDDVAGRLGVAGTLKASVLVFDEAVNLLRNVCVNGDPHELPKGDFFSGEGCAGFVFEKGQPFVYHRRIDTIGYFIKSTERTDLEDAEVLVTFPWTYRDHQAGPGVIAGVVNMSSTEQDTGMLRLFEFQPGGLKEVLDELQVLVDIAAQRLVTL